MNLPIMIIMVTLIMHTTVYDIKNTCKFPNVLFSQWFKDTTEKNHEFCSSCIFIKLWCMDKNPGFSAILTVSATSQFASQTTKPF